MLLDLFMVSVSWISAYWFRFHSGIFSVEKGVPDFSVYLEHLWLVLLIWAFIFRILGLYTSKRLSSFYAQVSVILKANTVGISILLALTYLGWGKTDPFSRLAFGWFWIFCNIFTILERALIQLVLRELRRRGYNLKYLLLVGQSNSAADFIKSVSKAKELGFVIIGILVTDDYEGEDFEGVPVLGRIQDLLDVITKYKVDTVVCSLPLSEMKNIADLVEVLSTTHVDVKIIPDLGGLLTVGGSIEEFDGLPIISIQESPIQGTERIVKRIFDLTLASIALVILSPVMLIIALVIKLTSKGPVFYSQERVTLDGTKFKIYKFRTMVTDSEKQGPGWTVKNDPRVTKVGRFLRKWSLDELPQLWNILKGDMSIVGPRPERPYFIKQFRQKIPSYMLRHKVPAGLTGLAQVNGYRGDTSIEERLKYDLLYLKNWSIFLDIKIILKTLISGIKNPQG